VIGAGSAAPMPYHVAVLVMVTRLSRAVVGLSGKGEVTVSSVSTTWCRRSSLFLQYFPIVICFLRCLDGAAGRENRNPDSFSLDGMGIFFFLFFCFSTSSRMVMVTVPRIVVLTAVKPAKRRHDEN
jgi:hypothetical protein